VMAERLVLRFKAAVLKFQKLLFILQNPDLNFM
ncbi:hypothetical protein EC5411_23736, partial [Escherichia coli 541-1]